MEKRLLAAYAHPDDEAFAPGGTLAHYAAEGVRITLLCATRGEAGEIADPSLATPDNLASVREEELRCAAKQLGIDNLVFLDYRDSGMAGTPENQHPLAFVNASAEEVVPQLVEVIRRVRPQVVLTFDPQGGYGHPDHIAIHHHTLAAFHAAGDPRQYPRLGVAWQPQRLFYSAIPVSFFLTIRDRLAEQGEPVDDFERYARGEAGFPDDRVNVRIDVSDSVDEKWAALECHRTQFGQDNLFRRLPDEVMKRMMSHEYFALGYPQPPAGLELAGLFAGLEGLDVTRDERVE